MNPEEVLDINDIISTTTDQIIDILLERKGFDDWWCNIGKENQAEICALIETAIKQHHNTKS